MSVRIAIAALVALGAASAAQALDIDSLAGVYKDRFQDALVTGEKYTGEDILEVVKVDAKSAYIRTHLDFFNGHTCDLYGIADLKGEALVYNSKEDIADGPCVFTLTVKDGKVVFGDKDAHCGSYYCGARGHLDGVEFPLSKRRAIRYLPRILASKEYKDAVEEHRTGKAKP